MTTEQDLQRANDMYPPDQMWRTMAAPNLTLPQFVSGNRINMFTSYMEQFVPLIEPKSPLMATSFEKPFGKYTDSYATAQADFRVLAVIPKFINVGRFNYIYVVQNMMTKVYDVIEVKHYATLSEDRGYLRPYTDGDKYKPGDIIRKGTTIFRSKSHDEFGNYRYGRNPRVAYLSIPETEEDGIVIREGYCDAFSFYDVVQTPISLNKNQLLLNLYGDDKEYKCFPDIGSPIKDGILFARRSINYQNAAAELTDNSLRQIVSNDEVFRGDGYVADIDIWINDKEEFIDAGNKSQIYKYYEAILQCNKKIYDILDPIVNAKKADNVQYTYALRWKYEHARNYIDQIEKNVQWLDNNNSFEFAYIVVTTYNKKKAGLGYKLTDRFGGKGVISHVWPDELMPRDEFGEVADLVVSPPASVARANIGRNYEQEYNFIAQEVAKRIAKEPTMPGKAKLLLEYLDISQPKAAASFRDWMSRANQHQLQQCFAEIEDTDNELGIYNIEQPFGGTISIEILDRLYTHFKIKPGYVKLGRVFKDTTTALTLENMKQAQVLTSKEGWEYIDPEVKATPKEIDIAQDETGVSPFDELREDGTYESKVDFFPDFDGKDKNFMVDASKKRNNKYLMNVNQKVKAWINKDGHLVREYKTLNRNIIGRQYYMLLKQMPDEKFSARSIGSTNQVGIPNKPGKQTKLAAPYAKSAIRSGEMEQDSLLIRIPEEIVHRYISTGSTNPELREKLATMLLTEDPFKMHDLPIKDEEIADDVPAIMFHSTLYSIGIEIKPRYEGE